jgi:hypothetical protein
MASQRKRPSYPSQGPFEENHQETSDFFEKEITEEVPKAVIEETTPELEPPVALVLPDITPTEATPPVPFKEAVRLAIMTPSKQQPAPQLKEPPKRHPRNTPKFSAKRG